MGGDTYRHFCFCMLLGGVVVWWGVGELVW